MWVQTPSSATTTVIATFNPNRRRSRTCARARPRVTVTRSFDFGVHHHRHHAQSRVRRSVNLFAAHGNTAGSAWQSYPAWTVVGELFRDRSSLHYKCSYCGWVGCPMMGLSDGDRRRRRRPTYAHAGSDLVDALTVITFTGHGILSGEKVCSRSRQSARRGVTFMRDLRLGLGPPGWEW